MKIFFLKYSSIMSIQGDVDMSYAVKNRELIRSGYEFYLNLNSLRVTEFKKNPSVCEVNREFVFTAVI